ncbi:MAG: TlpA family protein disulfide reductase [Moraxellaceae bacterium]|nr:MAG: TlpA family protein disulfide reductase [Moraxellaceae bacterium]
MQTSFIHDLIEVDINQVEKLIADYRKENQAWPDYLKIVDTAYKKALHIKPGNPAPVFTGTSPDGKKVSLSDFKGKLVYVDVWASWCGPCIGEIPAAKKLMEELKDKEVVFLNVSVDQSEADWRKAMEKHGVHGTNMLANGAFQSDIVQAYNINSIPRYLLIGRDGSIISSNAGRPSSTAKAEIEAALKK